MLMTKSIVEQVNINVQFVGHPQAGTEHPQLCSICSRPGGGRRLGIPFALGMCICLSNVPRYVPRMHASKFY